MDKTIRLLIVWCSTTPFKVSFSVDSHPFPIAWMNMTAIDISKLAQPWMKVHLNQTSAGKGYKKYRPKKEHLKHLCARCKHKIDADWKVHCKEMGKKDLAILKSPWDNYGYIVQSKHFKGLDQEFGTHGQWNIIEKESWILISK